MADDVSQAFRRPYWHDAGMVQAWGNQEAFNRSFIARVKQLREERGWTSERMARALGVPAERYRKYESRTPLPHYLIEPFAILVDRDILYVLTGSPSRRSRTLEQGLRPDPES